MPAAALSGDEPAAAATGRRGWRGIHGTALAAAAFACLVRLPFAAHRMWDHDSVQFALGVEKLDLAAHHPHPPGYPLYVLLGKLWTLLVPAGSIA